LVLSASLCVAPLGAVAALGVLPEREPLEGLGGTGAALLTVASVSVAAFGLGWDGSPAGLLAASLPVACMGLCPRRPGLIGASAALALALLCGGFGAAGLLGPAAPLAPLELLAPLPFVGLSVAVATRTLSSLREREGRLRRLAAVDELTAI